MASGINSTFRQIGFASAIAALGAIFAVSFRGSLESALSSIPALARHASHIAVLVRQVEVKQAIAGVPPALRGQVGEAIRSSFASGIDELAIMTGVVALVGAVCALAQIRSKDFRARHEQPSTVGEQPAPT
jgi:hypothetical protein